MLGLQGKFDEMIAVDPTAPARSVEENQRALRDMMLPSRNYQSLESLDDVISDVQRTPSPEEAMPEIREAQVDSEAMSDPRETE